LPPAPRSGMKGGMAGTQLTGYGHLPRIERGQVRLP
jgi:hypothetical protein